MSEQRIGQGSTVTLHFSLKFENGEVVDSNSRKIQRLFTIGDGSLLPGFERVVCLVLKAVISRTFEIPPEQGFGTPNEQNVQIMPRSQFDSLELDYGVLVIFKDPAGGEMPGVVKAFNDQQVDPSILIILLACKVIVFDVEIFR